MPKFFVRFVTLLLAPCLIADPTLVASFPTDLSPRGVESSIYTGQALAARATPFIREMAGDVEPKALVYRLAFLALGTLVTYCGHPSFGSGIGILAMMPPGAWPKKAAASANATPLDLVSILQTAFQVWGKAPDVFHIEWDLPAEPVYISRLGDDHEPGGRLKLQVLVDEAFENAFRYTPEGGTIRIRVVRVGNHVELSISDSGIGISAEDLTRVWDPHYRGREAEQRSPLGSGMGMTNIKRIAEEYGGSTAVESQWGQGTKLSVELPTAPVAQRPLGFIPGLGTIVLNVTRWFDLPDELAVLIMGALESSLFGSVLVSWGNDSIQTILLNHGMTVYLPVLLAARSLASLVLFLLGHPAELYFWNRYFDVSDDGINARPTRHLTLGFVSPQERGILRRWAAVFRAIYLATAFIFPEAAGLPMLLESAAHILRNLMTGGPLAMSTRGVPKPFLRKTLTAA